MCSKDPKGPAKNRHLRVPPTIDDKLLKRGIAFVVLYPVAIFYACRHYESPLVCYLTHIFAYPISVSSVTIFYACRHRRVPYLVIFHTHIGHLLDGLYSPGTPTLVTGSPFVPRLCGGRVNCLFPAWVGR